MAACGRILMVASMGFIGLIFRVWLVGDARSMLFILITTHMSRYYVMLASSILLLLCLWRHKRRWRLLCKFITGVVGIESLAQLVLGYGGSSRIMWDQLFVKLRCFVDNELLALDTRAFNVVPFLWKVSMWLLSFTSASKLLWFACLYLIFPASSFCRFRCVICGHSNLLLFFRALFCNINSLFLINRTHISGMIVIVVDVFISQKHEIIFFLLI